MRSTRQLLAAVAVFPDLHCHVDDAQDDEHRLQEGSKIHTGAPFLWLAFTPGRSGVLCQGEPRSSL
jgi:hypothetical protein